MNAEPRGRLKEAVKMEVLSRMCFSGQEANGCMVDDGAAAAASMGAKGRRVLPQHLGQSPLPLRLSSFPHIEAGLLATCSQAGAKHSLHAHHLTQSRSLSSNPYAPFSSSYHTGWPNLISSHTYTRLSLLKWVLNFKMSFLNFMFPKIHMCFILQSPC